MLDGLKFVKLSLDSHSDFEQIEMMAKEILPEVYESIIPRDQIQYLLDNHHSASAIFYDIWQKNAQFYLIHLNENTAGYLGIELNGEVLILSKLYLLKSQRGKRIGTATLLYVDEIARLNSMRRIEIVVHKNNTRTIELYRRSGFHISESLSRMLDDGSLLEGNKMVKSVSC